MDGENGSKAALSPSAAEPVNRIGLYVSSYSTDGSLTAIQEKRLRERVANLNRYSPLGEVVEVFRDHGAHSDTFLRPGFQALLRAIRKRRITLVVVPEFCDLPILQRDFPRILRVFLRARCGLRSLNEYLLFEDLRDSQTPLSDPAAQPAMAGNEVTGVSGGSENAPAL